MISLHLTQTQKAVIAVLSLFDSISAEVLTEYTLLLLGTPQGTLGDALAKLTAEGVIVRTKGVYSLGEKAARAECFHCGREFALVGLLDQTADAKRWKSITSNYYWSGKLDEDVLIPRRILAAVYSGDITTYRSILALEEGKNAAWKARWTGVVETAWLRILGGQTEFPEGLSPVFYPEIFGVVAANAFLAGENPAAAVNDLLKSAEYESEIPEQVFAPYILAAVYTWQGNKDALYGWLNRTEEGEPYNLFDRHTVGMMVVFLQGCIAFSEGNWEQADTFFNEIESLLIRVVKGSFLHYQAMPILLLFLLANLRCKKTKLRTTVIREWIESFGANRIRPELFLLISHFITSTDDKFIAFDSAVTFEITTPLEALFFGLIYPKFPKAEQSPAAAESCLNAAQQASAAGYDLLAIQILGAISWQESIQKTASPILKALTRKGKGVPLWTIDAPMESWEQAFSALESLIETDTGKTKKKTKKTELVSWWICLKEAADRKNWFNVESILPRLQKRLPNGSLSNGRSVALKSLYEGKYDTLLSEQDKEIKHKLARKYTQRGLEEYDLPVEVVAELGGHPYLYRIDSDEDKDGEHIRLEKGELQIRAQKCDDDSFELYVPFSKTEDVMVRKENVGSYKVFEVSEEMRKFRATIEKFGSDGKITVPASAQDRLQGFLKKIATRYPVVGHSEALGGENITTVFGETDLYMQVILRQDVLDLALRIKPFPTENRFVEPGRGVEQSMTMLRSRQVLLQRSLMEERRIAQTFIQNLPDLEAWATGPYTWRIENLTDALAVLPQLRTTNPPVSLIWPEGEKLSITTVSNREIHLEAQTSLEHWLSVSGSITLDNGKVLQFTELLAKMVSRTGNFVQISDTQYLQLTAAMIKRLEAFQLSGTIKGSELQVSPAAVPMLSSCFNEGDEKDWKLPGVLKDRIETFREACGIKPVISGQLKGTLRNYQEEGYVWMSRLTRCGMGACLADDMGLGKTIQIIALLLERATEGPSLVVAPASVCRNWEAELARFAPTLHVKLPGGNADNCDLSQLSPRDVVICSYGLLVSREDAFCERRWNGIILDEAQAIKNHASKRKKVAQRLNGKFKIAATGTPVENRLLELWSLFDFLNPGLLGTHQTFQSKYGENRIPKALKKLVSPLLLRRLKTDVLEELPPKTEITLQVQLTEEERSAYESCRLAALESLKENSSENRIFILSQLTRLRRFCCHPSLTFPDFAGESAKMETLMELVEELRENGHRALIFSQFVDFLGIVRKEFDKREITYQYLDGSTPVSDRMQSVNHFQDGRGEFFLISLKAGGTGLNLTAANYVLLLDPWWNPAVENQAADRAHRMGQKNPVTIYRLIAADTVEEKVLDLHATKKALATDLLEGTDDTTLSTEVLMDLFKA